MIENLANKSGVNFVDEIAVAKPFDLIFITSDAEDDCFKVLRKIESKKLTKPGTGKFFCKTKKQVFKKIQKFFKKKKMKNSQKKVKKI